MPYVKLEDVLDIIKKFNWNLAGLMQHIKEHCPTADVVKVVRCKDCTRSVDYEGSIMCNKFGHKFQGEWYGLKATTKDHFCSYGERKEEK